MALYKDLPNRTEVTSDPEKTVERVLDIANVLFHLDQVRYLYSFNILYVLHFLKILWLFIEICSSTMTTI